MLTTDSTSSGVTVTLHNNETSMLSNIRPVVLTLDTTTGVGTVRKSNKNIGDLIITLYRYRKNSCYDTLIYHCSTSVFTNM